ncbi:hypothetical protein BDZ97DRAFT_1902497 [Flammula alnicola]|nr:hypothetical protein BDZ97DRAFT_1902497 [Flammula alnicola]
MASDNKDLQTTQYACKCLNVRITSSTPPSSPPEYTRDPIYTPVFVKEDGISAVHPQVTIRLPLKGEPIPGTSKYSRFTALTCLFCGLAVYRVRHVISLDVEGNESTLFPTEDWVEHEIMKSASGWIDVHKDSIVANGISETESSSSYASLFSVALPPTSSPSPESPEIGEEALSHQTTPSPEAQKPTYLSDLRPLFLPPPFTSSHPIFVHLAGLASKDSQELRAAAEQRVADFVNAETAGIEMKEKELKRQVEALWKSFRHNLETVQQERTHGASNITRSSSRPSQANGLASPSQVSSSVTVRSFVPLPVSPLSIAPSSSAPRVSGLSASLATSKFYHPRDLQDRSSSVGSSSSGTLSTPRSVSSTLVQTAPKAEGSNVLQFKRNIDDNLNTQASYRYFVNLEEDMTRYKRSQEEALKKQQGAEAAKHTQEAEPSHANPSLSTNGTKKPVEVQSGGSLSAAADGPKPEGETTPSRARDKGKRKVTFDVEPAVVTIQSDKEEKHGEGANGTEHPMVFALEDLEDGEGAKLLSVATQATLPLLDQPVARPVRPRNTRPHNNAAHETFSLLRPSSLPNPSHIRPMRSQPGVDSFSQSMMLNLPKTVANTNHSDTPYRAIPSSSQIPVTANDAVILKLVAADTPSHRGAWTPESKAWQTFTRRQDSKDNIEHSGIPEEGEGESDEGLSSTASVSAAKLMGSKLRSKQSAEDKDNSDYAKLRGLPGSMPVDMVIRNRPRETLSLASYRPPTVLSEANTSLGPGNKVVSSTAIRKAVYAERDRFRSMDPGILDFATEEDEEEVASEESEHDQPKIDDAGEKGRKQALKILQARSELPGEGMWRSLA